MILIRLLRIIAAFLFPIIGGLFLIIGFVAWIITGDEEILLNLISRYVDFIFEGKI